jgi:hypothetical protein
VSIKLSPIPCPCGCKKMIMRPLFGCQCSSLSKDEADELVKVVNSHDELVDLLKREPSEGHTKRWQDQRRDLLKKVTP